MSIHGLSCFCGLSWILGFYVARGSIEANSFRGVTVPTVSVATYCFRSLTYKLLRLLDGAQKRF